MSQTNETEWKGFLSVFNEVCGKKDPKKAYQEIIETATNSNLTARQKDSIIGRCKWQMKLIDHPELEKKPFSPSDYDKTRM